MVSFGEIHKMKEEKITINIIKWLQDNHWEIICYDFPQSGTGTMLHPNHNLGNEKNKDSIIPDIIAVKNDTAVFFENKDRFYFSDFQKIYDIKEKCQYSRDLRKLVGNKSIYYGIGFPNNPRNIAKANQFLSMIDFLILVNENGEILIEYDCYHTFIN